MRIENIKEAFLAAGFYISADGKEFSNMPFKNQKHLTGRQKRVLKRKNRRP